MANTHFLPHAILPEAILYTTLNYLQNVSPVSPVPSWHCCQSPPLLGRETGPWCPGPSPSAQPDSASLRRSCSTWRPPYSVAHTCGRDLCTDSWNVNYIFKAEWSNCTHWLYLSSLPSCLMGNSSPLVTEYLINRITSHWKSTPPMVGQTAKRMT